MADETTYKPTRFGVATDYDYTGKRDKVIVWSGSFMGTFEAEGLSLPKGDGYMLTTYNGDKVRVECPTPRETENYEEIDAKINAALNAHYERIGARSIA